MATIKQHALVMDRSAASINSPAVVNFSIKLTSFWLRPERIKYTAIIRFARSGACEFLVDETGSTDREAWQLGLADMGRELPLIVDALSCKLIRLTPFAGDILGPLHMK